MGGNERDSIRDNVSKTRHTSFLDSISITQGNREYTDHASWGQHRRVNRAGLVENAPGHGSLRRVDGLTGGEFFFQLLSD